MGLFQKNPFSTENAKPLYTLGLNKTLIIVGLGNVGKEYQKTRHNIGFACVEEFAKVHEFGNWVDKKDLKCQVATKNMADSRVVLVKPTTMMNLSGEAVQAVTKFYKVEVSDVVAVYDEFAIPFGQIRTRMGGGTAGHNGVKSLVKYIGDEFGRVRVGIQQDTKLDMADFVLAKFSKEEQGHMSALTREATDLLTQYSYSGRLEPETRNFIV